LESWRTGYEIMKIKATEDVKENLCWDNIIYVLT
jgi:hypothetical protein